MIHIPRRWPFMLALAALLCTVAVVRASTQAGERSVYGDVLAGTNASGFAAFLRSFDTDSGGGTENVLGVVIRSSGSGGSTEVAPATEATLTKIAPARHCYAVSLSDSPLARSCTSWIVGTGGNQHAAYVADGVTDDAWHYNIPDGTVMPTTPTTLYLSADAGNPAANIVCCY